MASDNSWRKIFKDYKIHKHNFSNSPLVITNKQIKKSCQNFTRTTEKEVRILCKQDSREDRPEIFQENNLFILPIKNGFYAIIEGEGYIDIPEIKTETVVYQSKLSFSLDTSKVGDSEMQHLDYAYASSLIRSFMQDDTLVLTIRGRKYTPEFSFRAGKYKHLIETKSVQTEVDAGYEGESKVLLVEAKNCSTANVIIRQIYYPFRQWQRYTNKPVELIFFEKREENYCIWRFVFDTITDYNSIRLVDSVRYKISD
ncbi:type II restriction enzyme [Candidatus Spongiihabitans sp.]|uniref:type II restriction enzyme n=1 Tax=Candidatus Spongiihabitans sp. TaxID=3101308 RepID=UPI003C6F34B4